MAPSIAEAPERVRFEWLFAQHALFAGRDKELAGLDRFVERGGGYFFVSAPSGLGKTAMLVNWIRELEAKSYGLAYAFVNRLAGHADEDVTFRALCQQLGAIHGESGQLPSATGELRAVYLRLLTTAPPVGKSVVVVLDGIDEADGWQPTPDLFPPRLPDRVTVVLSAREIADRNQQDWLDMLGFGGGIVERLRLTTLAPSEISQILTVAGETLPDWAQQAEVANEIHAVSGGDPLYVRLLVGDLQPGAGGGPPRIGSLEQLRQQPAGLDGYFDEWWQQIRDAVKQRPELQTAVRDLLGYLLVARGPLSRDDLSNLSDEDALDDFTVDDALEIVARQTIGSPETGFALAHPRLQAYLAERRLGESVQREYRGRVCAYCSRWREHPTSYILRYYATHLADDDRKDDLFALARDPEYEAAQRRAFFDEPWLPLAVVEAAFFASAQHTDAAGMAEFALRKSVRVAQAKRESPLAVVCTASVEAAWALADLRDAETAALWHLLLAWELDDNGRPAEAKATLERLERRELPAISDGETYAELFATALLDAPDYRLALGRRLLNVEGRSALVRAYVALNALPAAVEVAETMEASDQAWSVHADIGVALARAGATDEARADLARAFSLANESTSEWRTWNLETIAQAQLEAGLIDAAIETAEVIDGEDVFASMVWSAISVAQAAAGRFSDALAVTYRMADPTRRDSALDRLADAAAREGAFERAGEAVERIADDTTRVSALATIAVERARLGDVDAALRDLRSLGTRYAYVWGIVEIAKLRADAKDQETAQGLLDDAAALAVEIDDTELRAVSAMAIAQAYRILGDRARARACLAEAAEHAGSIGDARRRASVLNSCGASYAENGELEDAVQVVDAARTSALQIDETSERITALQDLATSQAAVGLIDSAHETARALRVEGARPPELMWVGVERAPVHHSTDLAYTLALDEIAQAEIRAGKLDAAIRTGETLQAELVGGGTRSGIGLLHVALAQARGGDPDSGLQTATQIDERESRAEALAAVARAYLDQGRGTAARGAWGLLIEPPDERDRERTHADVLREAARAMSQLGRFDEATATAHAITQDETQVEVLANVAAARARAGEVDNARRDADGLDGHARTWVLVEVILAQLRADDRKGARETTTLLADGPDRAQALAAIAISTAKAGEIDAARDIAREVTDAEVYCLALLDIARASSELGDAAAVDALITETECLARAIEDVAGREAVLKQLAVGAARLARLDTAIEMADALVDVEARDRAQADIGAVLGDTGDIEGARAIAASIVDDSWRAVLDSTLAQQLARADHLQEALEAARAVPWDGARDDALHVVAEALARRGRDDEAVAVAGEVSNEVSRGDTFTVIAAAQAEAGKFGAARATADLVRDLAHDHALAAIARGQATQGFPQAACDTAAAIAYGPIRDEAVIAVARARLDAADIGGALATAATIATGREDGETLLADIALHQIAADDVGGALRTIGTLGGRRTGVWRIVLSRLHELQDRTAIGQLVISSADDPDLPAAICFCLAHAFPGEAADVARSADIVMSEFARGGTRT